LSVSLKILGLIDGIPPKVCKFEGDKLGFTGGSGELEVPLKVALSSNAS
jgi:hypothetical protein